MTSKWKIFGIAAVVALAVTLLYRRRRAFRGARGFMLLFRMLVAAGEAWREAVYRRRIESLTVLSSGQGPGPA